MLGFEKCIEIYLDTLFFEIILIVWSSKIYVDKNTFCVES
jgi:hypothetical protein